MEHNFISPLTIFSVLKPGAKLPEYKTKGAAGADVFALTESPIVIKPLERVLVNTGVFVQIPEGFELQLRPRSGLALKNGITVLNTPGTIDSDYRGELKVLLINLSHENFTVSNGDRIAQVILSRVFQGSFELKDKLDETERGVGGYGSTGIA